MRKVFFLIAFACIMAGCPSCDKSETENGKDDAGGADASGAVDLGLSVKWASCNLGASKPEEYGGYYSWGETQTKNSFSKENYKFYTGDYVYNPSNFFYYEMFSKYNIAPEIANPDNLTQLEPSDDAAYKKLGGKWRIPTEEEWMELRNNCIWTKAFRNGIMGVEAKSSNGNSIFFPAAGTYDVDGLQEAGSLGLYMSSTLEVYSYHKLENQRLMFKNRYFSGTYLELEGGSYVVSIYKTDRDGGYSIRPVQDK